MTSQQKVTEDVDMDPCAQGQEGANSQTKPGGDKRKERPEDAELQQEAEERSAPMAAMNWYCFNKQCKAYHTGSYPWVKKRVSPGRWRYFCLNCAPLYP
jgi:hypothetical protein